MLKVGFDDSALAAPRFLIDHDPDRITPRRGPLVRRWRAEEYALVDGLPAVYTVTEAGGLLLHLPGGITAPAETLRTLGLTVIMPRVVRAADEGGAP